MSTTVLSQTMPIQALLRARALGAVSIALTSISPSSIVGAMLWAGYIGNIVVTHLN